MNRIITVSRQFGSGGREFGRLLAKELGFAYYDKQIISEISKDTSMSEEYVRETIEGKAANIIPLSIGTSFAHMDSYFTENPVFRQMQEIYRAQTSVITRLAEMSDCVVIGRCSDYILKDMNPCRFFVHADIESRIKRCMLMKSEEEDLTEKEMKKYILALDKSRAKYYEFFTDQKWGEMKNYDICLNLTDTVIGDVVPKIARLFK